MYEVESPCLNCVMIPDSHHAQLLLKNGVVQFLRSHVWIMSTAGVLVVMEHSIKGSDICDKDIGFYNSAAPTLFVERHHKEFHNAGFTIHHGMMDGLVASRGMQMASEKPDDCPRNKNC